VSRVSHSGGRWAVGFLCALACGCVSSSRNAELREWALTGTTFRAVVDTAVSSTGWLDHTSRISDPRTYLLVVDLSRPAGEAGRARVYGPLWRAPERTWGVRADEPDLFGDDAARLAAPDYAFDRDGTLVCHVPDRAGATVRQHRLVSDASGARWKPATRRIPRPPLTRGTSDERARSNDLRYHLTPVEGGGSALIDRVEGRGAPDRWLEQALDRVRAMPDFGNVRLLLTDDLKYLVAVPAPRWNVEARPGGRTVETFELAGRTYARGRYVIVLARDAQGPVVVERIEHAQFRGWPGPADAYSIGGELFLYYTSAAQQRLVSAGGKTTYVTPPAAAGMWDTSSNARLVGDATVVVRTSFLRSGSGGFVDRFVAWDVRTGEVRRFDLPVDAWFGRRRLKKEPVGELRL